MSAGTLVRNGLLNLNYVADRMIRRRSNDSLGQGLEGRFAADIMDGTSPDELMVGERLLGLFGTGYTRILLVHLSPTASVSWNIGATRALNGGLRTADKDRAMEHTARQSNNVGGIRQKRMKASPTLVTTNSETAEAHAKS